MSSTDLKISKLRQTFPEVADESVLLEILTSCDGSLRQAEAILLEQFNDDAINRKRKIDEVSSAKYQSSIKSLFNGSKKVKDTGPLVRVINKSNTKTITLHEKEDIESTLPYITFHKNFLPPDVANNILNRLISDKKDFETHHFYIHGKECHSNHKSGAFTSDDSLLEIEKLTYNAQYMTSTGKYDSDMKILQMLSEDIVESLIPERPHLSHFQPKNWKGDFAVCNLFETKSNNLDWHSDRLSHIGPLPVIVSISLGATREFKLRKNHPVKLNPNPIYSIPLPHNTAVIMHSGCQEEYKHSITPSVLSLDNHPIANQMRFNLTLRSYLPRFYNGGPFCKCNKLMLLRRAYKDVSARGKYFWQCSNVYQDKSCGQFHWAQFDNENLITDDENACSVWIADDDWEKFEYLKENGVEYDKSRGLFIRK